MACRGCLECLLKLLNFLLTIAGLAMVGYGIYLLVEWRRVSNGGMATVGVGDGGFVELGRPMMLAVSLSTSILDKLPKAWFIYLFIGVGAIVIPVDKTGDFVMIYEFLEKNWKIVKWVALGAVILEALMFILALAVKAANVPADYDSDDEYIIPRSNVRQPLINRQSPPVTGVPVAGILDHQPSRNDGWSVRMREKYGLNISDYTYNPTEANRKTGAAEERGWCSIM
ncbi:hypothetical protein ACLOJK_030330 [Asimina triloba]